MAALNYVNYRLISAGIAFLSTAQVLIVSIISALTLESQTLGRPLLKVTFIASSKTFLQFCRVALGI